MRQGLGIARRQRTTSTLGTVALAVPHANSMTVLSRIRSNIGPAQMRDLNWNGVNPFYL
jgi:hypothetical protein